MHVKHLRAEKNSRILLTREIVANKNSETATSNDDFTPENENTKLISVDY